MCACMNVSALVGVCESQIKKKNAYLGIHRGDVLVCWGPDLWLRTSESNRRRSVSAALTVVHVVSERIVVALNSADLC